MRQIIGIDIGGSLTKVIEASVTRGMLKILALKFFKTPYQKDDIIDEEEFFGELYKIVSPQKMRTSEVGVSIPAPYANFSVLDLPDMPKADLDRAILSEGRRTIRPTPADDDILRYVQLKSAKSKDAKRLSILVGAAVKAQLIKYTSLFANQGFSPDFIGSTSSNLMIYSFGYFAETAQDWCFIDIGYSNTTMVIFKENSLALVRNIMFASKDFIKAIAAEKKVDAKEAEALFIKQTEEDTISENWEYLVSEIRRSFAYYKETSGGKSINSIYFSGGIFNGGQYVEHMRQKVGGKITLFDIRSLKNVSTDMVSSEDFVNSSALFANVIGLSLCMEGKHPTLNFLPSEAVKEKHVEKAKALSLRLLVVSALVLGGICCLLFLRWSFLSAQLSQAKKHFSEKEYEAATEVSRSINSLKQQVEAQKSFVETIKAKNLLTKKVLEVIAKHIPSNCALSKADLGESSQSNAPATMGQPGMQASGKNFKISGNIDATLEDAQEQLELLEKKLKRSGIFVNVKMGYPEIKDEYFELAGNAYTPKKNREFTVELELK
jgi:type IV pilus assembly protein PilM